MLTTIKAISLAAACLLALALPAHAEEPLLPISVKISESLPLPEDFGGEYKLALSQITLNSFSFVIPLGSGSGGSSFMLPIPPVTSPKAKLSVDEVQKQFKNALQALIDNGKKLSIVIERATTGSGPRGTTCQWQSEDRDDIHCLMRLYPSQPRAKRK